MSAWETGYSYAFEDRVTHNDVEYHCIVAHTSGSTTEPGVGASWEDKWVIVEYSFPFAGDAYTDIVTSKSVTVPSIWGAATLSVQRTPTDPYYYADVDIINMVVGSRWMLGYDNSGTFVELDSGTCATADFTISNVPSYGSPFLMELRVRKASAATKYEPLKVYAYHSVSGVTMYVSQSEDEVA